MRVLVTRPEHEARQWVGALRARGFDAQSLPLIEIAPLSSAAGLIAAWQRLDDFRAVMFVSGNAVRHFFQGRPGACSWPAKARAWSPGTGTRQALLAAGVDARRIDAPPAHAAQFDSETLWNEVAQQVKAGDRVMIVRGADAEGNSSGREWLAEQLKAGGAQVEVLAVYRRQPPRLGDSELARAKQCAVDSGCAWLFSSSQAVGNLRTVLPGQDWSQARAVATHPRIAGAARSLGFGVVCESRPELDAVVTALKSFG